MMWRSTFLQFSLHLNTTTYTHRCNVSLYLALKMYGLQVFNLSIFPPQVIFEATISEERQGYIALDDIVLLNYPCCKYVLSVLLVAYLLTFAEPRESVWLNNEKLFSSWKLNRFHNATEGNLRGFPTETPKPCPSVMVAVMQWKATLFVLIEWLTFS